MKSYDKNNSRVSESPDLVKEEKEVIQNLENQYSKTEENSNSNKSFLDIDERQEITPETDVDGPVDIGSTKQTPVETSTPAKNVSLSSIQQVEELLSTKYLFRKNLVSNKIEFKGIDDPHSPYIDMTDRDYNSILRIIKLEKISCSMSTLRQIIDSDFCPAYDLYIDYVESLPEWDQQTDYIAQLGNTVHTTNDELFQRWFKKWFVAMVASWIDKKAVNHTALILAGKQGIGKTSWFRNLVPSPFIDYVYAGKINLNDKDSLLKLSECPLIIMDELENLNSNSIDGIKEMITKSDIYVRRAYGFVHQNYLRRATFAGSTNGKEFLPDITGNRRFLCFEALEIDYMHSVDIDGAIAQAIHLKNEGFQYWFSLEEIQEIDMSNEEFRTVCREEEQLSKYYEKCGLDDPEAEFIMTSDLQKELSQLSGMNNLSVQKLGKVLNKLQYGRIKRGDRYGYLVKRKVTEAITN